MQFWDLGFGPNEEKELCDDLIGNKKILSKTITQATRNTKPPKCYYCGVETTELCNSHYVPAFCLRNISDTGEVNIFNSLVRSPLTATDKGIKNAGIFRLICRPCDSVIFRDYENPNNYSKDPSPKMLAQIAMKSYLRFIEKRLFENELYGEISSLSDFGRIVASYTLPGNAIDLADFNTSFLIAKRLSVKGDNDHYNLVYCKILDYVVPYAFQSLINVVFDLEGRLINNAYDPSVHFKPIHICVFPLESRSAVIVFGENNSKIYRRFFKQFRALKDSSKLSLINYMIFLYSEDIFLSKSIPDEVINDQNLSRVAKTTTRAFYTLDVDPLIAASEKFDLNKWDSIPNLLDAEFRLR